MSTPPPQPVYGPDGQSLPSTPQRQIDIPDEKRLPPLPPRKPAGVKHPDPTPEMWICCQGERYFRDRIDPPHFNHEHAKNCHLCGHRYCEMTDNVMGGCAAVVMLSKFHEE